MSLDKNIYTLVGTEVANAFYALSMAKKYTPKLIELNKDSSVEISDLADREEFKWYQDRLGSPKEHLVGRAIITVGSINLKNGGAKDIVYSESKELVGDEYRLMVAFPYDPPSDKDNIKMYRVKLLNADYIMPEVRPVLMDKFYDGVYQSKNSVVFKDNFIDKSIETELD